MPTKNLTARQTGDPAPGTVNNLAAPRDPPVYTVAEFCETHKLSRSHLYDLWKEGLGPRVMRRMGRSNISGEAAADFRRAMEEPAPEPEDAA